MVFILGCFNESGLRTIAVIYSMVSSNIAWRKTSAPTNPVAPVTIIFMEIFYNGFEETYFIDFKKNDYINTPPVASILCPVIHFASSEHKNAMMPPISFATPVLPKAVFAAIIFFS